MRNLETLRERRAALQRDRRAIERAPATPDEAAARLDALIAAAARRYCPPALLASLHAPSFDPGRYDRDESVDPFGMLCAVVPERMRAYLAEHAPSAEGGITVEARAARLAELDAQLQALERKEEAAVRKLEDQGLDLDRRPDAEPAIVLGV